MFGYPYKNLATDKDPRCGIAEAVAQTLAARNSPLKFSGSPSVNNNPNLNKALPLEVNNILVKEFSSFPGVLSPSDSPLGGKILFPDAKPHPSVDHIENRLDKLENQFDLLQDNFSTLKQTVDHNQQTVNARFSVLEQKLDQLLALFLSTSSPANAVAPSISPPIVQASTPTSSAQPSETSSENALVLQPTSVISKLPVPIAWNGTNSQVKAAASRSTPVPSTAPSIKASDPLPRPKVSQAHNSTSSTLSAFPLRAPTSPQLVHHVSRVAEGEPDCSNGSRTCLRRRAADVASTTSDPLRSGGGKNYSVRQDPRPSSGSGGVF